MYTCQSYNGSLENGAARMITLSPKYSHITPILFNLHWQPVIYRVDYKGALLALKTVCALARKESAIK